MASIVILLSACSSSPKVAKVDSPQVSLSKDLTKNYKSYAEKKENNLNTTWQKFNEPLLMQLIKKGQDNHFTSSQAKKTLSKYYKSNPQYQSLWENELFSTNIKDTHTYWYDLRTVLSAEITRIYFQYYFNRAQLSLLTDNSFVSAEKEEKIKTLNEDIKKNISSLEMLLNINTKELSKMLENNFQSIAQKIMENQIEFSIAEVSSDSFSNRPDIFKAISIFKSDLFKLSQNKAFPIISLNGSISPENNNIKIEIKYKDNNGVEFQHEEFNKLKEEFIDKIEKSSQETYLLLSLIHGNQKKLQNSYAYYLKTLSEIKENKTPQLFDNFIVASLDLIRNQQAFYESVINFYKAVE